jgi:hypothetical protein
MKTILRAAGAAALLALAVFCSTLSRVTGQIPRKVDGIRADVNTQLEFARAEISNQVEAARVDVLTRSERQLAGGRVTRSPAPRVATTVRSSRRYPGSGASDCLGRR